MAAKALRLRYWRSDFGVWQCLAPCNVLQRHVKHAELFPAPIEPIGKLIAIASQVFYRNLVVGAIHAALEQRERVLNRVAVILANPVAAGMIDYAMPTRAALADYVVDR